MTAPGIFLDDERVMSIAQEVWASFLGDEDRAAAELVYAPATTPSEDESVTGTVTISGAWTGSVLLTGSPELAAAVASEMFMTEPAELAPDEIYDAFGELTNMVGGTIKAMLPAPSQLSIPTVTIGRSYVMHIPGARLVSRTFLSWRGETITVTMWEG